MSRALKGLAKELKVPMLVVLSQLTRAPEREDRQATAWPICANRELLSRTLT